eukprot:TRINITY_DN261_c0_g1_i10.p1 TRINITY_DN261_c0_g1~~TRINITY_DN261_c0_g1_i10.p1  ORF type:complete len:337 (+),score=93.05 TRINITY_DN261_c0_g1_i10:919-1929(+)
MVSDAIKIAIKKVKVISLRQATINSEKDNKDNKFVIKIDVPSSPSVLLKASNPKEFGIWYNTIQLRIVNLNTDNTMRYFEKGLEKVEYGIARVDKKEVTSMFLSVGMAMKTEERRTAMFEDIARYNLKYKYLEDLYNSIKAFETMCKLGKTNNAVSCASTVYKMITNFELKDIEDNSFDSDLEMDVREMMREVGDSKFTEDIPQKIKDLESSSSEAVRSSELFKELIASLYRKIEEVRTELHNSKDVLVENQEFKMLAIPISFYKKACHWTMPTLLNQLMSKNEDGMSPRKSPLPSKNAKAFKISEISAIIEKSNLSRNITQANSYCMDNTEAFDL